MDREEGVQEEATAEAVEAEMAMAEADLEMAAEAVEVAGSESEGMASFLQCTLHCTSPRCDTRGHRPV